MPAGSDGTKTFCGAARVHAVLPLLPRRGMAVVVAVVTGKIIFCSIASPEAWPEVRRAKEVRNKCERQRRVDISNESFNCLCAGGMDGTELNYQLCFTRVTSLLFYDERKEKGRI